MGKMFNKIKSVLPTKRRWIQLYSALLFNANIKGFFNGRIYTGPVKNICTPGLNCYSCPGASGACPLGSLQNSLYNSDKSMLFYVVGCLMLYGILAGRFICGFLCPFGFIQELLYKIKTPKLKKGKITRILSGLKYVILVFLVIIVPIMYALRNVPLPGFCKYICPAGTLEGAIGLLANSVNESKLSVLGPLFTWKFALLVSFILLSVFIFRFFCRFFCPLGAIYGIFNRFSVFGIKLERSKCIDCGLCHAECKMDIKTVGDRECIMCGECVSVCPTKAISWRGSKIFLPPNEIEDTELLDEAERAEAEALSKARAERTARRNKILKTVLGTAMTLLLAITLIYFNFIDKPVEIPDGNNVGDLCIGYDVPVFDESGLLGEGVTFNPAENYGKITVINFWGVWCSGCVAELPDFDRIAADYEDKVTVLAVHTEDQFNDGPGYVLDNYSESKIIFGKDKYIDPANVYGGEYYYTLLGGEGDYPMTVILDEDGVIIFKTSDSMNYDSLKSVIDEALGK